MFAAVLLFFVMDAWSACQNTSTGALTVRGSCDAGRGLGSACNGGVNFPVNCPNQCNSVYAFGDGTGHCVATGVKSVDCNYWGTNNGIYFVGKFTRCDNKCEADSIACLNRGNNWRWNSPDCKCEYECHNRTCCDSLNQNSRVKTEKRWLGCVAENASDNCFEYNVGLQPGEIQAATCNGASQYEVCTMFYYWSQSAQQCAPLATTNCQTYTVRDSLCSNVICKLVEQNAIGGIDYNSVTHMYSGTITTTKIVVCTNGTREDKGTTQKPFTVSKDYLDAHGMDIYTYIRGGSGSFASGGSYGDGGGGSGGGGDDPGGDPEGDSSGSGSGSGGGGGSGCVGNGCAGNGMADVFDGGPGVDAQGNPITNTASPGIGGGWTPTPEVVTETDSNGNITIVKNSEGGDSVVVTNKFNEIKCLGIYKGIATMSNGLNTWTCEASSCSQAVLSASILGGKCSPGLNGIKTPAETNPSMPMVTGDASANMSLIVDQLDKLAVALDRLNANMNANLALMQSQQEQLALQQQENLWKVTFGNDLSYVHNIENGVWNFNSVASQGFGDVVAAIQSAASNGGSASGNVNVNVNMGPVVDAIQSASSRNTSAIASASSLNASAIASATSNLAGGLNSVASLMVVNNDRIHVDITSNTSAVENLAVVINSAASYIVENMPVPGSASGGNTSIVDTVHRTNTFLEKIEGAVVDTGKNIPKSIWSLDSSVNRLPRRIDSLNRITLDLYADDKLKVIVDTNTRKVKEAIDTLHGTVRKSDSLRAEIRDALEGVVQGIDTMLHVTDSSVQMGYIDLPSGDSLADSIGHDVGYDRIDVAGDTAAMNDAINAPYDETDSTLCVGSECLEFESSKSITDSMQRALTEKGDSVRAWNRKFYSDSLTSIITNVKDSVKRINPFGMFDSTLMQTIGAKVPNTNSCPEHCSSFDVELPFIFGNIPVHLDYKMCVNWSVLGNLNVLQFIRFLIRCVVAFTCIAMVMNEASKKR